MKEILKDPQKRRIEYLRVSVTDRCNLGCLYCGPEGGQKGGIHPSELLTPEEIERAVRTICGIYGLRKVRLTGGEPLMRKDLLRIVSSIKALGIKDLSMTTNGHLLPGRARELKEAGLDRINFSMDTLRPERYRALTSGGDMGRLLEAIASAEEAGLYPVKLNMVPIRGLNEDEIASFAALTFKKDYHIRFIEHMPIGPEDAAPLRVTKDETMREVSKVGELVRLPFRGGGPSRNYRLKGAKGVIGFISPMTEHFCGFCNRLRIGPSGKIRPCLLTDIEVDLAPALKGGAPDDVLEGLLRLAVSLKPEKHRLGEAGFRSGLLSMSEIGG